MEDQGLEAHHAEESPTGKRLMLLSLAAVGIVYGDIGTSPIYALRESFHHSYGMDAVAPNILGVLSLIFWSLVLVISVKYLRSARICGASSSATDSARTRTPTAASGRSPSMAPRSSSRRSPTSSAASG